jgi:hypothetical protein
LPSACGILHNVGVYDGLGIGGPKNGTQWNVKPDHHVSVYRCGTKLRKRFTIYTAPPSWHKHGVGRSFALIHHGFRNRHIVPINKSTISTLMNIFVDSNKICQPVFLFKVSTIYTSIPFFTTVLHAIPNCPASVICV